MQTLLLIFVLHVLHTEGKSMRFFNMPGGSYCSWTAGFQEVDGGIVRSVRPAAKDLHKECKLQLVADDKIFTTKKMMVKFQSLRINDCNTKLAFYDSSHSRNAPMKTFTCGTPIPKILYTTGKYLVITFNPGGSGNYLFEFLITTYRAGFCSEFKCKNRKCIEKDLVCDGYDSCFDGSDEYCGSSKLEPNCDKNNATCSNDNLRGLGFSMKKFIIGILVVIGLVIVAVIVCIVCCVKKGSGAFGKMFNRGGRHSSSPPVAYEVAPTSAPSYPPQQGYQPGGFPSQPGPPPAYGLHPQGPEDKVML